jgi:hypothetical protein
MARAGRDCPLTERMEEVMREKEERTGQGEAYWCLEAYTGR